MLRDQRPSHLPLNVVLVPVQRDGKTREQARVNKRVNKRGWGGDRHKGGEPGLAPRPAFSRAHTQTPPFPHSPSRRHQRLAFWVLG